jgi:PAS domain S-box-containing protein
MSDAPASDPTRADLAARPSRSQRGAWLPLCVLVAGGALTAWMYFLLQRQAAQREQAFFGERVAAAEAAIQVRVTHYIDALKGGVSLLTAAPQANREMWRVYAESLQMRERYPGINGLGVIFAVPAAEVGAWQERLRAEGENNPLVRPFPGTADTRPDDDKFLITFVEGNVADSAPTGRNIATEPSRRRAAELARDSGRPHIHQRLPGSRDMQRRSGLLLYVPLYRRGAPLDSVAQRRAAHLGWVYAQVFPDVFLQRVMGGLGETLRLHFFEGTAAAEERLLFASAAGEPGAGRPAFERVSQLTLAGEPFTLGWQRGPRFPAADRTAVPWVAGSMGAATLLLAGLVASLQSFGQRARELANRRTAELAAAEERSRQAFDFAGIGMALVALDGQFLRVNRSLCDIVGYPEARLLQKKLQDLTHPGDVAAGQRLMAELAEGRRRFYQLEQRYQHREGHTVWIRLTASLVRDLQGDPQHAVVQVEDITDRKQLEASLARARDEAMEDSRFKSEFLAAMVNQIRAPANEIIAATMRLRNRAATPEQLEPMRALEQSGDAFLKVLNDILDYAALEFAQVELERASFEISECVLGAVGAFEDQARAKQVRLETAIAPDAPARVVGDARRLRQILLNLLGHALKYTEAGHIRVSLMAEAFDAASGRQRLKFAVRDTGSGLAANAALHRAGGDIGLAISKRLTELMGGTLWTESEPGRGTTFHFTLSVALP